MGLFMLHTYRHKKPTRYKLSPTSLKGIFVRYRESSKQYRVYIPTKAERDKAVILANVRFFEDSFWDWSTSSNEQYGNLEGALEDDSTKTLFHPPSNNLDSDEFIPSTPYPSSPSYLPSLPSSLLSIPPVVITPPEPSSNPATNMEIPEIITPSPVPEKPNSPPTEIPEPTSGPFTPRRSNRTPKLILPRLAWQPTPRALYRKWHFAIQEELESLGEKKVFTPVTHVPHGRKPVGSRWVFAVKSDGRFKERLVAKRFSQVFGVGYLDTYSPTLRTDSLRTLLSVVTFRNWEIHQVDVKTAYLEGTINEVIYMKSTEGMEGTHYLSVNKALYGLKQSGKAWYAKLDSELSSLGLEKSNCDPCVYINKTKQLVISVYIDDLVILGSNILHVEKIKEKLSSKFPIKDLKEIDTIIGWRISRDRSNRTLEISQAHYLADKIKSFGLEDAKPYNSPIDRYVGVMPAREGETSADESAYPSATGSLGYAADGIRPDIYFATSHLASFNSFPTDRYWNSVCRIFRYVKGT
ncbi:hypothetical protein K3495_g12837 [Podosphaera aphanis]|nr:hypothetical protein K3495_g12837 [Podosphaera aphanis]